MGLFKLNMWAILGSTKKSNYMWVLTGLKQTHFQPKTVISWREKQTPSYNKKALFSTKEGERVKATTDDRRCPSFLGGGDAIIHLSKSDLDKLAEKSIFSCKVNLKVFVYTSRRGTAYDVSSRRLQRKVSMPLDLIGAKSRAPMFHSG